MSNIFLSLKGIPTFDADAAGDIYFYRNGMGEWVLNKGSALYEIDNLCVTLHDKFAIKVYGSYKEFYDRLVNNPEFIYTCGMNSESAAGRDDFERFVNKNIDDIELNKALYLYDCRKLVSSVQESNKEISQVLGEFYRVLNLEEIWQPKTKEPDGIRFVSSPVTSHLNALLAFLFIRMHSLLDYLTKLAFEAKKLKKDFARYPRMASKNILFSARKDLRDINKNETIFEECDLILEVEELRNHLIHDGLLDDMPKVYKVNKNGDCIEKYILLPDRGSDGRLTAFKNRNLFYSGEDKINLRLPGVVTSFQDRQLKTLDQISAILN